MSWTPELRKQHRRCVTNWKRPTLMGAEEQVRRYLAWRAEQGLTGPVAVFPRQGGSRHVTNRVRGALWRSGVLETVEVDVEDYV